MLRLPLDLLVVLQHLVDESSGLDEPGSTRVLDQRILTRPRTEGIVVAIHFLMKERPLFLQLADQFLVTILDPASVKLLSCNLPETTVRFDCTEQLQQVWIYQFSSLGDQDLMIHLTKCRCLVYHSTAAAGGHEISSDHSPHQRNLAAFHQVRDPATMLLPVAVEGRAVTGADQVRSHHGFLDGQFHLPLGRPFLDQIGRDDEPLTTPGILDGAVLHFWMHCDELIRDESPGRGGPCDEVDPVRLTLII